MEEALASHLENVHAEVREITGRFIVALPVRRTFEFLVDDTEELVSGGIHVYAKRVGTASARYVLMEYDI